MLSTRAISSILRLPSAIVKKLLRRSYAMPCEMEEKFKLPKRYGEGQESVWAEFLRVANETKALNLGQGFPDSVPLQYIKQSLANVAASEDPLIHQYTRGFGHPRLVNILAKLYSKMLKREIDPMKNLVVACGAFQSLFNSFYGHVEKGDEVIIVEPFFECYAPMVEQAGGIAKFIPLRNLGGEKKKMLTSSDFCLDEDELKGLINDKTKIIMINSPNNPIGKVFAYEELEVIANLCKKHNLLCISDEVYEWMIYKPNKHIRMATMPDMWDRTITIGSAGKTFSITGWKTGWACGPDHLMKNLRVVHQNVVCNHVTPVQEAIAIAFETEYDHMKNNPKECYFYSIVDLLTPKRDFLCKFLSETGLTPVCPDAGYFIIADWTPLEKYVDLSKEKDNSPDYRMAKWMAKNYGLLGIPLTALYGSNKKLAEKYIRYCFLKEDKKLKKAANILSKLKEEVMDK